MVTEVGQGGIERVRICSVHACIKLSTLEGKKSFRSQSSVSLRIILFPTGSGAYTMMLITCWLRQLVTSSGNFYWHINEEQLCGKKSLRQIIRERYEAQFSQ